MIAFEPTSQAPTAMPAPTRNEAVCGSAPTARPIPAQGNALGQETHEQRGLKARPIAPAAPIPDPTAPCVLDGQPVPFINADLTTGSNTASAHRLNENAGLSFIGDQKGGKFELTASDATALLRLPANPNGKTNADVIRHWINGSDITSRSRGLYIIDFGVDMSERNAAFYEAPFERTKVLVYPTRKNNRREVRKKKWWIHHEPMPAMRAAVAGLNRYIVTPRVSKHRIFVWVASETLADSAVVAIAREDEYFFGLLHSKAHEIWARAQGTQLREMESGFRYTPNSTFDTFPFPWPPGTEPTESEDPRVKTIADAAHELVRLRDAWLNPPGTSESDLKSRTLTNLYNARPEWLANAHRTLDEAVFSAYGWPLEVDGKALTTQEILARLLALNHQRAAAASPGKEDR
jgi:type II restriction/modification system DNA methylase subunit YeeA